MNAEVTKYICAIRDEIVAHYYAMKLNASGEFDRETQVEEYPLGVKIVSPQHISSRIAYMYLVTSAFISILLFRTKVTT